MPTPMNQLAQKMRLSDRAFTLIELLLTFSILVFCLCGLLLTYINMYILSDLSRDLTLANNAVQAEMEIVKRTDFAGLLVLDGTPFNIAGFVTADARGRIEICDNTTCPALIPYADLKRVRIIACFRSRGRLIGEDQNLNGALDIAAGEDVNDNVRLDSPVEVITLIAR